MPYHLLIDGALVDGTDTINVIDPTMAQPFAQSPRASAAQAEAAIQAAKRAQPAWEALGYEGRRPYLERFAEAITANLDPLPQP
jgi:acyl-CoA reductase-like NAD-dependent aldehyde dehydrogenase